MAQFSTQVSINNPVAITIVSSHDFLFMLSAPPEIMDGEFVEVEALEDGRDDDG